MSKRNYYCLVAGLPDIIPDDKKQHFSSVELRNYLRNELHQADFNLVTLFYLPFDNENLLNLFFGEEFEWDDRGNYPLKLVEQYTDKKLLEELDFSVFPEYFSEFIKYYLQSEEEISRAEGINKLTGGWYELLFSAKNDFVTSVADYKQRMGNIMLALNGRKYDIPYEHLLIGEGEIINALKKSHARDFGLSNEIKDIESIIQIFEIDNVLDREMKLDTHFWKFLDDITFFNYFSIEKVLAFMLKLFITERWFKLDKTRGQQIFNQFLEELKTNFEFPEEFAITYGKRK
jgi:hypothetical protein